MYRSAFPIALLAALLILIPAPASAKLLARIDLSQQRLHLYIKRQACL